MKEKKFSIGDYDVVMQTPKHSAVMNAELNAMDVHPLTGIPFVNEVKLRFNRIAASLKSVKYTTGIGKGNDELINNMKDAEKFLVELDEDQYLIFNRAYSYLVTNSKYDSILKNFAIEDSGQSSTPQ